MCLCSRDRRLFPCHRAHAHSRSITKRQHARAAAICSPKVWPQPENCIAFTTVYLDFTDLPCHAGTPQDLVNPWTLAFGPAGDALYVATDPNHRTVHRFDAAGTLVRAERCADEAPNYLLCV